ncbi:carbohydrate ABC transporter membrane protein 2, CUT1 family [Actinomadura madurae]|uniref:Carbohydrate ABC transporter membrane protein 2, CUT1 family n=2 Tax=Actinomadura madurae TaxID=1993 RepID=A0A1I4WH69_9ACTN|nr:carbohydrate ABC transporter membrane protein 2, CUT1 family [Actinomadura madurae]SPT63149.1 Inner membrane ABC transporter permease protein ycjP [Actinomadura madurae]
MRFATAKRPGGVGGRPPTMKRLPRRIALNGTGLLVFLIAVFPVFWMASTAFKPNTEIFSTTPKPLPAHPTLTHFDLVLNGGIAEVSFWEYFRNSAILALVTVLASGLLALMAATAVARFRFRFRTTFLIMLLVVQMVPLEALVIPLFLDLKQLELLNSLSGLAIVYIGFAVPFAIWMLRGFVAAVPRELEEAAAIDGAGPVRTFFTVMLPLVAPGLVATSIFSFITAWNEFIFAFTFLDDQNKYTLPIMLQFFFGRSGNAWGPIMAASTLLTIPVIVFFLLVQRRMVSGLTAGAVKG